MFKHQTNIPPKVIITQKVILIRKTQKMASFVRITGYAMWVMMTYLTNIWKLSFTHAAGIINIWGGLASILPLVFAFIVDTLLSNYAMLLISSIAYSIGLGLLAMSTPPVLSDSTGTCSEYKPECIGQTQKVLFYTALALIAVGISGHIVSLISFLTEQTTDHPKGNENDSERKAPFQVAGAFSVILVAIGGGIALPYIKPWSIRFGIPAICTLVATLLFISGTWSYIHNGPKGSPGTTVFRVLVASASKICQPQPNGAKVLYKKADSNGLPHTDGLR
ncbi:unnamed protein product [Ilex paraguariensis]|uniref:Uncharacterized protein n=1 Tax=Ilex paraguariensis TaxID=185542 RepID=A0ABC8QN09_9AQUA